MAERLCFQQKTSCLPSDGVMLPLRLWRFCSHMEPALLLPVFSPRLTHLFDPRYPPLPLLSFTMAPLFKTPVTLRLGRSLGFNPLAGRWRWGKAERVLVKCAGRKTQGPTRGAHSWTWPEVCWPDIWFFHGRLSCALILGCLTCEVENIVFLSALLAVLTRCSLVGTVKRRCSLKDCEQTQFQAEKIPETVGFLSPELNVFPSRSGTGSVLHAPGSMKTQRRPGEPPRVRTKAGTVGIPTRAADAQ